MKKKIIAILILLTLTSCVNNVVKAPTDTNETTKTITIDIDEELELLNTTGLKDDGLEVFDEPIYVGDNDEVSFKGSEMQNKSPLFIKIGNKKEIKFSGSLFTIKTAELKSGDEIIIKDRYGNVFVHVKVVK